MKKQSILWAPTLILSGVATLAGCSSNDEDSSTANSDFYESWGLTRKSGQSDSKGFVVKLFERNGLKLQVVDITEQFESATFFDKKVSVNHVFVEQLPAAIQKLAINYGESSGTRVCRMEYEGEVYYDIYSVFSSSWTNFFNSNGERHYFQDEGFLSKAKDVSCILVLTKEPVKNAEGAPNYLIGYWQTDWQHLVHDHNQQTTVVPLS